MRGLPEDKTIEPGLANIIKLIFDNTCPGIQYTLVSFNRIGRLRKNEKGRPIQLIFSTATEKKAILKQYRDNPFNCSKIKLSGKQLGKSEDKIFLNEELGPVNSNLFYKARKIKEAGVVKHAWIQNGAVMVREADNMPSKMISCSSELASLSASGNAQPLPSTQKAFEKSRKPAAKTTQVTRSQTSVQPVVTIGHSRSNSASSINSAKSAK